MLNYPVIVKPRYGCGSISVAIAYDEEDLRYLTKKANEDIANSYLKYESAVTEEKVIYQECLKGQEYGADIINDLYGETQNVIVRKKLAMAYVKLEVRKHNTAAQNLYRKFGYEIIDEASETSLYMKKKLKNIGGGKNSISF